MRHPPYYSILKVLAFCLATMLCLPLQAQFFEDETKEPENKIILASALTISGSLGYVFGVGGGAISASAFCSPCETLGTSYNATFITATYIGTSLMTAALVSATAKVFNEPPRFFSTLLGSSIGGGALPLVFYSISGSTKKRYAIAFSVSYVTTVFSAIIGYYLGFFEDSKSNDNSDEKDTVTFVPLWQPGSGSLAAVYKF